jgi:hypothetical protein
MCFVAAIAVLAAGCGKPAGNRAANSGGSVDLDSLAVGEAIRHDNLAIFPVISKTPRNENPFITLDEGLAAGTIEIRELGSAAAGVQTVQQTVQPNPGASPFDALGPPSFDPPSFNRPSTPAPNQPVQPPARNEVVSDQSSNDSRAIPTGNEEHRPQQTANAPARNDESAVQPGRAAANDVNRLLVLNKSNKPLYLMPGEIIVGGQQDRVIGTEVVLQPSEEPQTIDVFCVEHGRWRNRDATELAGYVNASRINSDVYPVADLVVPVSPEAANPEKAAAQAAQGKFVASVGRLNKGSRLAVQEANDQSKVWSEVSKENLKSGVANGTTTGAFTKNYADNDTLKKLQPLMEKIKDPVGQTENIVGVVVAVDGKIDSMDVFQSTPLFRQLWPKLLKSYALDAVNAASTGEKSKAAPAECTKDDAKQFLTKAFKADERGTETKHNVAVTTRGGEKDDFVSFTASEDEKSAGAMGGGGGFGGGVHTSAFAK